MNNYSKFFLIEGKTALITGGTSGLGSGIARAFLESGANVAVCGRHLDKASDLQAYANENGYPFLACACDVTDLASVKTMLDIIQERFGDVQILINSAGMNQLIPAESYDDETFDQVMRLNLHGLHLVTREVGKRWMIPNHYGRILNLSSVKSLIGTDQNYIAYCASKGAVNMYTKQLACEWGKYGISCNAIAPTFVRTPINSFQLDDPVFYQKLVDRIPLGRIGKEQDIACAALYLCSDAAAFVSGQILCVDGGLTAKQ